MPDIEAFTSVNPDTFHYRNKLPLLSPEEKVALLSGVSFTSTAGIARLNIPALKVV
jgi:beta-glucosidase